MYPTLAPGERVLVDRLAYARDEPQRGDVVLAAHPGQRMLLIKRIAATPGDEVAIDVDRCWVNGISLDGGEDAAPADARTLIMGGDEYFLLGDDPSVSADSRQFGAVKREALLGRAWMVYWPPKRMRRVSHTAG